MYRKTPSSSLKAPVPEISTVDNKQLIGNVSKWIPLICAGGAIGISIFALKELKNTRKELMLIKKESFGGNNEELSKRMENMEEQLKSLADFIKKGNQGPRTVPGPNFQRPPGPQRPQGPSGPPGPQIHVKPQVVSKEQKLKESVVINPVPTEINIINESDEPDEYEEVEVTDDEEENEEE